MDPSIIAAIKLGSNIFSCTSRALETLIVIFLCAQYFKTKSNYKSAYFVILNLGYMADLVLFINWVIPLNINVYYFTLVVFEWYITYFITIWNVILCINRCTALVFIVKYEKVSNFFYKVTQPSISAPLGAYGWHRVQKKVPCTTSTGHDHSCWCINVWSFWFGCTNDTVQFSARDPYRYFLNQERDLLILVLGAVSGAVSFAVLVAAVSATVLGVVHGAALGVVSGARFVKSRCPVPAVRWQTWLKDIFLQIWTPVTMFFIIILMLAFPFIADGYTLISSQCTVENFYQCMAFRVSYYFKGTIVNAAMNGITFALIGFCMFWSRHDKTQLHSTHAKTERRLIYQAIFSSIFQSFCFILKFISANSFGPDVNPFLLYMYVSNIAYHTHHYVVMLTHFILSPTFKMAFLNFYHLGSFFTLKSKTSTIANPSKTVATTKVMSLTKIV